MSAVTQPFRPCHAKQATAYLSMAKHDNKNISLLLWYIASRTPNFTFEMTNQKKNNRTDELFTFKYSKMLSFSQVAEALTIFYTEEWNKYFARRFYQLSRPSINSLDENHLNRRRKNSRHFVQLLEYSERRLACLSSNKSWILQLGKLVDINFAHTTSFIW